MMLKFTDDFLLLSLKTRSQAMFSSRVRVRTFKQKRGRRPSSVKEMTRLALEVEKIYSASQKSTPKALPFTP